MEYIDFHDFQDEYVPLKKELKSLRQSLFEVDDCEKRAEILSRIDSADWQLHGLHLKFGRCFPDIAQALDNGATLENFETMLNVLVENSELAEGIEPNIMRMIQDIGRYPQMLRSNFYPFFYRQFLQLVKVLSCTELVEFCFEKADVDKFAIVDFVRWLNSEMFSCEVEAEIKKFFAAICAYADGRVCSVQQKSLLDICAD